MTKLGSESSETLATESGGDPEVPRVYYVSFSGEESGDISFADVLSMFGIKIENSKRAEITLNVLVFKESGGNSAISISRGQRTL